MLKDKTKPTTKIDVYPSINLKRETYKSSRIRIIVDTEIEEKSQYGFFENDVPDYAK